MKPKTGAFKSYKDSRTVKHSKISFSSIPLVKGGVDFGHNEIGDQMYVGICVSISRTQLQEKRDGRKYCADFYYLCLKKLIDQDWGEGSQMLSGCKVAQKIGFLPLELSPFKASDRNLGYAEYIKKLQSLPLSEFNDLLTKCVSKIKGYASVDVNDSQAIAKAIVDSPKQAGVLCRYEVSSNWWSPSWAAIDISPLRKAGLFQSTSGHAIIMSKFDYSGGLLQTLANTWGILWGRVGCADIVHSNYKPTEVWVDLPFAPIIDVLKFGSKGEQVKTLQSKLNLTIDGNFGQKTKDAVIKFQLLHGLVGDGVVGKLTINHLNKI